jgi:hypothetical protein
MEEQPVSKKELSILRRKEYMKNYLKTYRVDYYLKHKDELKERNSQYNKDHLEHIKQVKREWYLKKKQLIKSLD